MRLPFLLLLTISYITLLGQDPQQGWDFTYPGDNFSDDAVLDLRYLNESVAGENGYIQLSEDGASFRNDAGPIRFWAMNGGELVRNHDPNLTQSDLDKYARFLSKMGVNMLRYHGEMFSTGSNVNTPNRQEQDDIWQVVAAMKNEGIYTTISPFWPAHMDNIPASWGLGDYVGGLDPWGLLYFDQHFRDAYKSWVTELYTEENPYTGIPLKDDPAVGLIQILNEDGVFFWTIGGVQPSLNRMMQAQFYDWAISKYGSADDTYNAWEQTRLDADNMSEQLFEIIQIWHATDDPNVPSQSDGFKKRLSDQMMFFAETQRATYQELYDHYRSIGCKQLINACNWRTASASRLLDLERWSNLPGEVMALNRYYDPGHFGPNSGWRIERLHHYQGHSALHNPHRLPINIKQVSDRPFLVTESGWNLPHKYQAEGPFLIAAYQSLTGVDGFYWFSPSSTSFEDDPYWPYFGLINGQEPMFRWTNSTPGQIGMFPANALAFRLGYIKQGEPLVQEERTLQAMADRVLPVITEEKSFDPNRDTYTPDENAGDTELSPLTYLAGPVTVTYDTEEDRAEYNQGEVDDLVDIQAMELTSNTGELYWDYDQGICTLDAPKVQGICGFPESGTYDLSDVIISTANDYLVAQVVSMDDNPLPASEKIFIQIGTVYQPTGWEEVPTTFDPNGNGNTLEGFRIEDLGRMPWKGSNIETTITLKNMRVDEAWQLNAAGYKETQLTTSQDGDNAIINLPESAMYIYLDMSPTTTPVDDVNGQGQGLRLFPNPTSGQLSIDLAESFKGQKPTHIIISDPTGKQLKRLTYNQDNTYNLGDLAAGMYHVAVHTGDHIMAGGKVMVE